MKKLFLGLVVLTLLFLPFGSVQAADSLDQSCNVEFGGLGQFHDQTEYQTFTPSMNRLSKVAIRVDGGGGGVPITLKIYHGGAELINAGTQNSPFGNAILTYDFADIEVTPGDGTYRIWPQTGGGLVDWIISAPNCNLGGTLYRDGADQNADAVFYTYGYNYSAPAADPTASAANQSSSDSPSSTANVSTTIKAPSQLKAEAVSSQAVLTWKASSSTDIDGYKVYRSSEEKKNFKEITKVDKKTLTYTDPAAAGLYYYYVRAYKGTSVSSASNTASVTLEAVSASATPTATPDASVGVTAVEGFWSTTNPWMWIILAIVFLLVAGGGFFYYRRKKLTQVK